MFNCGKCARFVMFDAKCCVCSQWYHYPCAGIAEEEYLRREETSPWKCPVCSRDDRGPDVVVDLQAELARLGLQADETKEDTLSLASSDVTASRLDAIERRLASMEASQDDLLKVQSQLDTLEDNFHLHYQYSRSNNLEIFGLPQTKGENLYSTVLAIGREVGFTVRMAYIDFVARVPSRVVDPTPVVVAFTNRHVKEGLLRAVLRRRPLKALEVGLWGDEYLNIHDHLTVHNKVLLGRAREVARDHGYEYVKVRHSKICVRRNSRSETIVVRTEKDLAKIV